MKTTGYYIVWPEYRWVSDAKIDVWFSDAVDNGEFDEIFADTCQDTYDKARALHGAGLITLKA